MEEKKEARGGKRSGAGRKPKGNETKIQVSHSLDSEVVGIIKSQPNQAAFLEEAVREKFERMQQAAEITP